MLPARLARILRPVALALAISTGAHAADGGGVAFPDMDSAPKKDLGANPKLKASCNNAAVFGEGSNVPLETLSTCFGAASKPKWEAVRAAANQLVSDAKTYYSLDRSDAPDEGPCQAEPAKAVKSVAVATLAAAKAADALKAKEDDLASKQKVVDDVATRVKDQQAAVDAASKLPPNQQTQALVDKLSQLKSELAEAEKALAGSKQKLDDAKKADADADTALTAAKEREALASSNQGAVEQSMATLRTRINAALNSASRSPADFDALLDDPARLKACLAVRTAQLEAIGATAIKTKFEAEQKQARDERAAAHRKDLLRKAEDAVSGAFSSNGFIEQPGSPDKVIFSLMSALGADSRTNGTQLVMTLNVASLFSASEAERLKQDATWRNLTLRANLPLDATDNTPVSGSATPTESSAATQASKGDVSRFSVVVGSSLADDTDQRLPTHNACYDAVLAYRPFAQTLESEKDNASERADYYDICHRRAAHSARWAWRAAAGFITPEADDEKTRLELWGLAAVWGPNQLIYVNAFHQHVLEPRRVNVYGLGLSFGGNVAGRESGVDSWARVGLDLLGMYAYTFSTATEKAVADWELRITPNIRAKVLGNSVATLGLGPRILAKDASHPALLASLSLTYDVDALIDQTLVTPAMTPEP